MENLEEKITDLRDILLLLIDCEADDWIEKHPTAEYLDNPLNDGIYKIVIDGETIVALLSVYKITKDIIIKKIAISELVETYYLSYSEKEFLEMVYTSHYLGLDNISLEPKLEYYLLTNIVNKIVSERNKYLEEIFK